ncbi:MAG: methionyl-tRNA formyltransferase [Anaerolineae bacterium]|nr:methionyl-tRNA formyltransferase [Anaerolineae bacterium]
MTSLVFMGTPDFSVPILQSLIEHYTVIGVVTQPDRPAGRKQQIHVSPVKQVALNHGIPVLQPERLRRPEAIAELKQWQPDVYVVAAFGQILPQSVLDIPKHGSINVHASILPRWRGAAPIQAVIRAGDAETGVTIMKMDAGLDTGPMLRMRAIPIVSDETGESLHDKLSVLGAELLMETLPGYLNGTILPQPQPEEGVTFAPQVKKEEGNLDWSQEAQVIERLIRAFTPWPGTFSFFKGQQFKIINGSVVEGSAAPGRVIKLSDGIAVGTGHGLLRLHTIQLAGRKAMSVEEFIRGQADFMGATLAAPVAG